MSFVANLIYKAVCILYVVLHCMVCVCSRSYSLFLMQISRQLICAILDCAWPTKKATKKTGQRGVKELQ